VAPALPFGGDVVLADTSVWRRADKLDKPKQDEWVQAVAQNQVAASPVVLFELLYRSKNNPTYFHAWRKAFAALSRYLLPDRHVWTTAEDAYVELQAKSELNGMSLTDVVVAATATRHDLPVLHVDKDYDRLAKLDCMDFEPRRLFPKGEDVGS
jgi:predicted nucleic acid-binding protein